ncbi:peptidase [Fulvitalea axinellae]|uniref:Peptidase n=1 Tax=Fulvitalea axinellae TaxID=1182444 RepID=A0AAU9CQQ8_9BACT|nr:peptidase [Fulvitalea axinellae]
MKRIKINEGTAGIVLHDGEVKGLLKAGKYWLMPGQEVKRYDMAERLDPPVSVNILLRNKEVANALRVVDVKEEQVALRFEDGMFKELLPSGRHLYWDDFANISFTLCDKSQAFVPNKPINTLLKHKELAEALEVIEVKDGHLTFRYEEGLFKEALPAGRYLYWKGLVRNEFVTYDIKDSKIPDNINKQVLNHGSLDKYVRFFEIQPYEKALLYIDGELAGELERGTHYFWINSQKLLVQKIDTRVQTLEVSGQEMLTQDKVNLRLNFSAQYRVHDIHLARVQTKDYEAQLYQLFQLALREYVGTLPLDELLAKKESVASYVKAYLAEKTKALGLTVLDCGLRDLILPGEIKEIMNQVLVAQKKAQANIITRREETASTRSLLNTAKLMEDNPMLFKLKEMEYVEKISEKISEISLSNGGQVIDQLKGMFGVGK